MSAATGDRFMVGSLANRQTPQTILRRPGTANDLADLRRRPTRDPPTGGIVIHPVRRPAGWPAACMVVASRSSEVDPARVPRELQRLPRGNQTPRRRLATSARQDTSRPKQRYWPSGCALDAEAGARATGL